MLCYHSFVGIVTGQYPLEESGGNVGGPLSQMSEAVNKIDNGANQANTGNGMGSSGNGLSASNEIFHNNKVQSLKVIVLNVRLLHPTVGITTWHLLNRKHCFSVGSTNALHPRNASNTSYPWWLSFSWLSCCCFCSGLPWSWGLCLCPHQQWTATAGQI